MYEKPYSHPRWNDTSLPKIIGHFTMTEADEEQWNEIALQSLVYLGVIPDDPEEIEKYRVDFRRQMLEERERRKEKEGSSSESQQ